MSRRVRIVFAALFALILVIQTPVASAATRDRESGSKFVKEIVRTIKKVIKPLVPTIDDDTEFIPGPPKP